MRKTAVVLPALVFMLVLAGCTERETPAPPDTSRFPLQTGKTSVFSKTLTTWTTIDTVVRPTWLREIRDDTLTDQYGRTIFRLLRFEGDTSLHPHDTGAFRPTDTWTETLALPYAERTEGAARVRPLQFPETRGARWTGAGYLNLPEEDAPQRFEILAVDTTVVVNGQTFEGCVVVQRRRIYDILIFDVWTYEVYAPRVGRIKRLDQYLHYEVVGERRTLRTDSYILKEELLWHDYF